MHIISVCVYVLGFHSLHTFTLFKIIVLVAHKQKERYRASTYVKA